MVWIGMGGAEGDTINSWSVLLLLSLEVWVDVAKEIMMRRWAKARTASQFWGVTLSMVCRKRGMAVSWCWEERRLRWVVRGKLGFKWAR